ncbi:hypothetical protein GALL_517970 [mine drainage metagenome]|uniref:Uncharacterized protein n=1 Tax=mine drainage metagenome TaxID=410659 RepID=A0A1J5P789_9ZZZZ
MIALLVFETMIVLRSNVKAPVGIKLLVLE